MTTNNKQRLTLFINSVVVKQARVQAVVEEVSLTNLVEKALMNYLPKEIVVKEAEVEADSKE